MDRMCTRCARTALRQQRSPLSVSQLATSRTFTTSLQQRADDTPKSPQASVPTRVNRTATPSNNTGRTIPVNNTPQTGGQVQRRTYPPRNAQSNQRSGPPQGASQGAVLRRTGPPPQPGQILRRSGPPRQGGRPGTGAKGQGPPGKQRRRRTAESVKAGEAEDQLPTEEELDEYMTKYIDRPANPTERIAYNPKAQDMLELQKDWPNTPLSTTGLSASLVQKIEWLARRIPHGYQTPEQVAEHFQKGNLTRFESEDEKQKVLKIAAELAQKRAAMLSERKGSEVAADDMGLVDLSSRNEKKNLSEQVVKGGYGDLEKQKMPFLDSVMRNLRNNQTYHKVEMDKFMTTVQKLMPAQAQRRPQPQAQKRA